jgi:hypothetical protein
MQSIHVCRYLAFRRACIYMYETNYMLVVGFGGRFAGRGKDM